MAIGADKAMLAATKEEHFTPVDAVVVQNGGETARPTPTFVICQDEIIDRYYKLSSETPRLQGRSLKAAWDTALASGAFDAAPSR